MSRALLFAGALAACNSPSSMHVGTDGPLGPPIDASSTADAPWPIDAAPPLLVTASSLAGDGSFDPSAIVVSPDLGGTLQSTTIGPSGAASVTVPYHATVSVLQERAGSNGVLEDHYTSFFATEFGDYLRAGPPHQNGAHSGNAATMTVKLPADHAGAALFTECGAVLGTSGSAGAALTLYDSCGADSFGVLALDGSGGSASYTWQENETFTTGGTLAIADAFRVFDPLAVEIANVPAGLGGLEVSDAIVLGPISPFVVPMDDETRSAPAAGSATVSLRYPLGAGDETFILARERTGSDDLRDVVKGTTTSSTDLALDLAAHQLPAPALATRTTRGLAWTETGTAAGATARIVTWRASWHDGAGTEHDLTWIVVDDPTHPTSVTLPTFPADLAAYDPFSASDLVLGPYSVEYIAYDVFSTYRAGREFGESLADVTVPLPATTYTAAASRSPSQ